MRVHGLVANPSDHGLSVDVEFIVDTGAIYSVVSRSVADRVRLVEKGKRKFRTGSGIVELPVCEAYLTLDGDGITTLVAVTDSEETPALLGVTTLELLGLQVDPVSGKLKPLDLLIL